MRVKGFETLFLAGFLAGSTLATGVGEMNIDMAIKYGIIPRATNTNLQVRSPFSRPPLLRLRTATDRHPIQTFTGALGGASADPVSQGPQPI